MGLIRINAADAEEAGIEELHALAQLCKRFTYDHAVRLANSYDGGRERDQMLGGIMALQRALANAGHAPR